VIGAFGSAVAGQPIDWAAWGISTLSATVFLALGLTYFSRAQRSFADIV